MSSKTLAVTVHAGRLCGAVIESSIGSLGVVEVFDLDTTGLRDQSLPVAGPFDRVISTLSAEAALFRVLDLPFRDRRRLAQSVGPFLEEHVPFSLDDGVLAWDLAGPSASAASTTPGGSVLAALAQNSQIDAAKARLLEIGVETAPQRLLWAPTVILAAYRRAVGDAESFVAVDLSETGAVIARFEGGRLTALRVVASALEELLLRNTAWSIATIAGDETRAVVGGRYGATLSAALAKRAPSLRVEALPPASPVNGLKGRDWRECTVLAGLVLAASGDTVAPILDFEVGAGSIFGVAAWREMQSEAGPLLRWGLAAAALALLAIGLDYVQLFAERSALAGRAEQLYTSAMPTGSGGAGRKLKMEMRLRELSGKAETAGGGAGSPLALLAALSRDVPKNLDVVVDQVEHSPPAAKVTGHAASFETVTKMQEALQKGGAFSRVEVKDVHAAVTGGGVEFLLEITTTPAEGGA